MSLRMKCFIILCITFAALMAAIPILSTKLLLSSYEQQEQREVRRTVQQVEQAIKTKKNDLDIVLQGWSNWDDMYYFMSGEYDDFQAYVLDTDHHIFSETNAFIILDTDGELKFGQIFKNGTRSQLPPSLQPLIDMESDLFKSLIVNGHGLIQLPEGPMMVVGRPIHNSKRQGEPMGYLLMGRYLDSKEVQQVSENTHTSFNILGLHETATADKQDLLASITDSGGIYIKPINEGIVAGYAVMRDLSDHPIGVIQARMSREIYYNGQQLINQVNRALTVAMLLVGVIAFILLDYFVIRRVGNLDRELRRLSTTNDFSASMDITGTDEVSSCAQFINSLIWRIEGLMNLVSQVEEKAAAFAAELQEHERKQEQENKQKHQQKQTIKRGLGVFDPLTGVLNRAYYEWKMMKTKFSNGNEYGLVLCEIDGLKLINNSLGRTAGNNLLIKAARVIKVSVGNYAVCRVSGDRFAVVLSEATKPQMEELIGCIQKNVDLYNGNAEETLLSLSIGYSLKGGSDLTAVKLLEEADHDVFRAKLFRCQNPRGDILTGFINMLKAGAVVASDHIERSMQLCQKLAQNIGLPDKETNNLKLFAKFHQLGKVETQDAARYPEIGYRIAQAIPELIHISDWILKQRERWDGKGHPFGIGQTDIPLACRIMAILDAYDVMTQEYPDKKALTREKAINELNDCAGVQFDPRLVSAFVDVLRSGSEDILNANAY